MPDALRILVLREGETLVAQCLGHDICTQANDINTLRKRMHLLIDAELGDDPDIGPAPDNFHKMWDDAAVFADGGSPHKMALAA